MGFSEAFQIGFGIMSGIVIAGGTVSLICLLIVRVLWGDEK